jgi:hypothetical protein
VGRYAIFARPGFKVERLYDLRDVSVSIGEMARSHFTTLKTLGEVLPKEHIKVVHAGEPGQCLLALLDGELEAANLLDPEIPIAEAKDVPKLAQGEFIVTFWVSPAIGQRPSASSSAHSGGRRRPWSGTRTSTCAFGRGTFHPSSKEIMITRRRQR